MSRFRRNVEWLAIYTTSSKIVPWHKLIATYTSPSKEPLAVMPCTRPNKPSLRYFTLRQGGAIDRPWYKFAHVVYPKRPRPY